jgi:ATP-dependent RNA helicase RhlE
MTKEKRDSAAQARPNARMQRAPIRALVLSPTRELAAQIDESLGLYGKYCGVNHAMVCGGVGLSPQVRRLQRGVDVLVATPGRLEDLMAQRIVDLSSVEVLVLDEVDRMLDQGFLPAVRRITSRIPKGRQTLLFSATMPPELRRLALELMVSPVEVAASQVASTPDTIDQVVYHVSSQLKRQMLEHLVSDSDMTRALVFTRTKHGADRVVKHLKAASVGADALHGGKTQSARERALNAFRDGSLRVLVATDLAARGIHVDGISHVINFDLPLDADNYVHRIGRTARAGASGKALSLCCAEERDVLHRIEKLIRRRLPVQETPPLLPRPPRVAGSNYTEGDQVNRNVMPRPNSVSRDSAGGSQVSRNYGSSGPGRRSNHSDGNARGNGPRFGAGSGNSGAPSARPWPRPYRPN